MISVCIPVYNSAKYIGKTLDSLLKQTYKDLQVIVSDNASTDGTDTVVESFKNKFPLFKYIRSNKNLGYTANVARAVSEAESEHIAIFHADDIYSSTIIEREEAILSKFTEISGVFTRAVRFNDASTVLRNFSMPLGLKHLVDYESEAKIYFGGFREFGAALLKYGNFFVCPSFMTRKKEYVAIGGFQDAYPTSEDLHLWIRYLKAGRSLAVIDEPLMRYRISDSQGSAALRGHLEQSISFLVMEELLIPGGDFNQEAIESFNNRKAKNLIHGAINTYLLGKPEKAKRMIAESRTISKICGFSKMSLVQRIPIMAMPLISIIVRLRRSIKSLNMKREQDL